MKKIKLFKGVESEMEALETSVNDWLAENNAELVSVSGNISAQTKREMHDAFSASDIFLIVVYQDNK